MNRNAKPGEEALSNHYGVSAVISGFPDDDRTSRPKCKVRILRNVKSDAPANEGVWEYQIMHAGINTCREISVHLRRSITSS